MSKAIDALLREKKVRRVCVAKLAAEDMNFEVDVIGTEDNNRHPNSNKRNHSDNRNESNFPK